MVEKSRCRLCFVQKSRPMGIFTAKGKRLKIASIIRMHFSDEVNEDDALPKFVCSYCWTKTTNFHDFYNTVIDGQHVYLNDVVKNEEPIFNEINCESFGIDGIDISSVKLDPLIQVEQNNVTEEIVTHIDDPFHSNSSNDCEPFHRAAEVRRTQDKKISESNENKSEIDTEPENHSKYDYVHLTKQIAAYPLSDLSCDFCKTTFRSLGEAKRHYRMQHKNPHGYIKCCKQRLKDRGHLIEHIQWHTNPDTFKCQQCHKLFTNKRQLSRHTINHEPDKNRKFKCKKCNKTFLRKHILTSHMKQVHSVAAETFECDICNSRLKSFNSLKAHILHAHVRQFEQICDQCGKVCLSKADLERHQRSHGKRDGDGVQCTYCSAMLKCEFQLKRHISRIHESAPANCPHCSKISPNRNALAMHIKTRHKFKVHKCHMCDRECKSAIALMEHLATHTGEYLYDCVYCPKKFKSHSNMYIHFNKAHPIEWSADRKTKPRENKHRRETNEIEME